MNNSTNFFDLTEIEITLTYPFLNQAKPMRFFLRPILSKEEKEARQTFFGLTEMEQEEKRHEHNVNLLSTLSVKLPENVPTFPIYNGVVSLDTAIKEFFSGTNAMKIKVVEDTLNLYFQKTQPQEFFR